VLLALIKMFRDLRGAKFYHQTSSRLDFARAWARWGLRESKIIAPASNDLNDILAAWGQSGGPWRDVFLTFWTAVRDKLADTENPSSPTYWGHPRTSNLFNKPMLMTLATDFFSYMNDTGITIQKADDVKDVVDRWLRDVEKNYFARDWKLAGVKKDSVGTRKQWSKLWYDYRRDPVRLPPVRAYSLVYKEG
jgi:hypothetical protein